MTVNTAHASRGVLIHSGEHILLHYKNVDIEFPGELNQLFRTKKPGYVYLTSHRIIFRSKRQTELLQSLSAPFIAIDDILVKKDSFSLLNSNLISGKVRAQPNGNFNGKIEFKLFFKHNEDGIEFGSTLLRAISIINQNGIDPYPLPPYETPRVWYEAPLEMHKPLSAYKRWLPTNDFFHSPSPNAVYMTDNPPPFQGIDIDLWGYFILHKI